MSDGYSDDAKVLMGGWFGLGLTEVSFLLRTGRPTKRCQAAIDELVDGGALWREPHGDRGFRLKPRIDAKPYEKWLRRNRAKGEWPLMEDIPAKAGEAKRAGA